MVESKIAIVVPMYRIEMDEMEQISWKQLTKLLGKYKIYVVCPRKIAEEIKKKYKVSVEMFADSNFESIRTYSEMMLKLSFYERFHQFDYMLIYQLDAFVFEDKLMSFCKLGYDYIGAPWPYWWMQHIKFPCSHIGNGGFSLRKISSACRILRMKEDILKNLSENDACECRLSEDVFWAHCAALPTLKFTVPPIPVARKFAAEWLSHIKSDFLKNIPFGCHNVWKMNTEIWEPYIKKLGYDVPKLNDVYQNRKNRECVLKEYLVSRFLRPCNLSGHKFIDMVLCKYGRKYAIWGAGEKGESSFKLFSYSSRLLFSIYDHGKVNKIVKIGNKKFIINDINAIPYPEIDLLIISTTKYYGDIKSQLVADGLIEGKNFIGYWAFVDIFFKEYFHWCSCLRNLS